MRLRLRRNEMRAVIDRRAGILLVPNPAHIGITLIHIERNAVPHTGARKRQPRRPGPHDANARISFHIARSAWPCPANEAAIAAVPAGPSHRPKEKAPAHPAPTR